jgi:hypothetical protein
MTATMGSAPTVSTMKTSSAVDAAAAECVTPTEASATVKVTAIAAVKLATPSATEVAAATKVSATVEPMPVIIKVAPAEFVEAASAVKAAAEPWPRADEDAAGEPRRPVVAHAYG